MANLEPSRSWIAEAWSIKLILPIIVTFFYLTKSENRTKKSLTQLSYYCFESRYYFCQKMQFFFAKKKKKAEIIILRCSWYYKVYFLKLHMCVFLYTKFQVSCIILTSFIQMKKNLKSRKNLLRDLICNKDEIHFK